VGFTYASVLSGATFGTVLILALSILIAFNVAYIILFFLYCALWAVVIIWSLFHPELTSEDWELDANQFDRKLEFASFIYLRKEPTWAEIESGLRRRRELGRLKGEPGGLTPAEASELEHLNSKKNYTAVINSSFYALRHWLRPGIWYVYALFLFIIGVTAVLTVTAFNQADTVRHGEPYFGNQSGSFAYHAEIAYVEPVSTDTAKSVQQLVGKRLFLLGENAQYLILYSPDRRSTIRIPVNTVVVTSSP
jgi:hypothetical protein